MDEQEFNIRRDRAELVQSEEYKKIKKQQLEMIISYAASNGEPLEIRGMLKLIGKTDEWLSDFRKIQKQRR